MVLEEIREKLILHSDSRKADLDYKFFKAEKGGYGDGDQFLGVKVPVLRKLAKEYKNIEYSELERLLQSKYHEERLLAVFIMLLRFKKEPDKIYKLYVANISYINNWDLVDVSAHHIVGVYLHDKDRKFIYKLASSKNMWERRIAIVSTFYYIKNSEFELTLDLAKQLLFDKEDLIHKAVGWMLRELGKRNEELEKEFLHKYKKEMPRTMLRYAIEKFSKEERATFLRA